MAKLETITSQSKSVAIQFLEDKIGLYNDSIVVDLEQNLGWNDKEWGYVEKFIRLYTNLLNNENSQKTKTIGSLMTRFLNFANFAKCKSGKAFIHELHHAFTVPQEKVSLPDIAYLYSMVDYRELKDNLSDSGWAPPPSLISLKQSFSSCFIEVANNNSKLQTVTFSQFKKSQIGVQILPCADIIKYPVCKDYCTWHKNMIDKFNKDEFLTIMKYSLPHRKILLEPILSTEQKLAERLFGSKYIRKSFQMIAPMTMPIFCYQENKGFLGDDIGMAGKFCNDFFPTPTDDGICLTKNLDIKEVMNTNKQYDLLFEPHKQIPNTQNIKGGSLWSESTLVIYTDINFDLRQSYPRTHNQPGNEIQFQLSQHKEFPQMLWESKFNKYLTSTILENGNEYFFDVTPTGQIASSRYKSLDLKQRRCFTENEISENSIFKIYTEKNCKYECHVTLAMNFCHCIPWDFMTNITKKNECDVFGRTCFFNAIKNLTQSEVSQCIHCRKACDHITYSKKITKQNPIGSKGHTKYLIWKETGPSFQKIKWITGGMDAFMDFFLDNNNTITDKVLKNTFDSWVGIRNEYEKYNQKQIGKYENLIIIHLRFLNPEIDWIDTKYSLSDKFANFGGKFGIFAHLTGASLLALINICVILFKIVFSSIYY